MKSSLLFVSAFGLEASAFPAVLNAIIDKRQGLGNTTAATALSAARTNCGPTPCNIFDAAEQYVSTTGDHAYASPAADEIRGPCPGLNAAANHGYLSRSGVTTIQESVTGLGAVYGLDPVFAAFLAAYGIIMDGDPVLQEWSIGGPPPGDELTKGLLGGAQGISYSHNVYEGDASIARNDAYINNGDAHSLNVDRFASAYALGVNDGSDRYTLDKIAQNFASKTEESIQNNPYYFAAPFAGTVVAPAAYNFVINFMSNHSAEEPSGYLNGEMFKQFFAVNGTYPNFNWLPGQERIPDNWYRRPSAQQYTSQEAVTDLAIQWAAYPDSFRMGGNVNGVNTYEGVDLADFTGGAMHTQDLFDTSGNSKAMCFYAQLIQSAIPDSANVAVAELAAINSLISEHITPVTNGLDCPVIDKFDQTLFNQFPGHTYSPTGPATNYRKRI